MERPGGSWDSNVALPLSLSSHSKTQQGPIKWTSKHEALGFLLVPSNKCLFPFNCDASYFLFKVLAPKQAV